MIYFRKNYILLCVIFLFLKNEAFAQQTIKQFQYNSNTIGYYEHLPDDYNQTNQTYPVILFLHGSGEMGNGTTDLPKVLKFGPPSLIDKGIFPKSFTVNNNNFKFIVISPQLNPNIFGASWSPAMLDLLLNHIKANYRIDVNRIYLTGLSLGGAQVWYYTGQSKISSDKFAAIAPVCGAYDFGTEIKQPQNIADSKLPVWAFHGADDLTVSAQTSRNWVSAINTASNSTTQAKLTVYPATGHDSWTKAYDLNYNQINNYSTQNLYEWLLTNSRNTTVNQPPVTPPPTTSETPQLKSSANDAVNPYTATFKYGANMGYYGNGWDDNSIAGLVNQAGGRTLRLPIPEYFIQQFGVNVRLNEFKNYATALNHQEITCFIETPSEAHRDKTKFGTCASESKIFANLYTPIWNADGTVNTQNYFAKYVYDLVTVYGPYVRIWEVWNEPDLTNDNPTAWLTRAPNPCELVNLNAPIYSYIRMMRITYEVVKKYDPQDYVATGGIGYPQFLDALLRYSDNPEAGAVSTNYPLKGGAYFDILSYHSYPAYRLRQWDNSISNFRYTAYSDKAVEIVLKDKSDFEATLKKYGYGSTYPAKPFIITETNVSRRTFEDRYGSDEFQKNFGMKMLLSGQKANIKQIYLFVLGEAVNFDAATNEFQLMGLYENLTRDRPGTQKLTQEGVGFKTTANLLLGFTYDETATAALQLPTTVEGAAFKRNTEIIYALWAKTNTNRSEAVSVTYKVPLGLNIANLKKYDWNFSQTNQVTDINPQSVVLTGSPAFFAPSLLTTNIAAESNLKGIKMYPNPSIADVNVMISNTDKGVGSVEIYSLLGTKMYNSSFSKTNNEEIINVPTTDLKAGIYILRVNLNGKTTSEKIIKYQ